MFAFARKAAAAAPSGGPLPLVVVSAHIEQWLSLSEEEDDGYFKQPDVLAELHAAADRSVRHPAFRRRPGWPAGHNALAFAFALAGDHAAAKEQFTAVGDLVTDWPWCYLGDESTAFAEMRKVSLKYG
ncbi:hypothetical protein [Microtetraspora fusca]|uniref:hypothetical protein n=1 Tax=Microtetraspora fusca TaxID=1997 RepID=UPI0012FA13A7|nr:hypothetical protein [Microtetraspora fusca]